MSFRGGQGGAGGTGLVFAPPGSVIDVGDTADEGISNAILRADARWSFPAPNAAPTLDALIAVGASGRPARQDAVIAHTAAMHLAGGHADLSAILAISAYRQTTGSVPASSTADVVVNLAPAMPDTNYTVEATVEDSGANLEVVAIKARTVGSVTVTVRNNAGGAHTGTLHLELHHDSQNPTVPALVDLGSAQDITGLKNFAGGLTSRTVGGGQVTAKPLGEASDGIFNWIMDDDYAYLFHLVTGPNCAPPAACIGIGVDNGGYGLLVNNKVSGRGVVINNFVGVTEADSYALIVDNRSTVAPGAVFSASGVGAKPGAVFSADELAGSTPGRLVSFQGAPGGVFTHFGHVTTDTGEIVWNGDVTLSFGDLAIGGALAVAAATVLSGAVALHEAVTISNNKKLLYRNNANDVSFDTLVVDATNKLIIGDSGQVLPVSIRAGGVSLLTLETNGTTRVTVDSQGITVQDGKAIFAPGPTGLKIGSLTTHKLGFFGATPVARQGIVAAATDPATTQTLANAIRTAFLNLGLFV